MHKIPTLFLRDPDDMGRVTKEVNPEAAWVLEEDSVATVKKDGTNVRVTVDADVRGRPYLCCVEKRRNPSLAERWIAEDMGRPPPEPAYVLALPDDPADKHIWSAVDATDFSAWPVGSWPCEALGPKIRDGVESDVPRLYPFSLWPETIEQNIRALGAKELWVLIDVWFRGTESVAGKEVEGVVWHGEGNKMCKIKAKDFGLPWPPRKET